MQTRQTFAGGEGSVKGRRTKKYKSPCSMKNKRRSKLRKIKEAELREKEARQRRREELEASYADEFAAYQEDNRDKRVHR